MTDQILRGEWMSIGTMGFAGIDVGDMAGRVLREVFAYRNREKVPGINARPIGACVMKMASPGDWADQQTKGNPVSIPRLATIEESSLSCLANTGQERPALVWTATINLLHESVKDGHILAHGENGISPDQSLSTPNRRNV